MENSCLKKYKPSSKKWILASRCAGLRRNSALIPANAGLFHYAGNNPVRYIDPDGRDIIILNRSYGAGGFGHNAILIGNDKTGWTYFSKDGKNPVNGRYNPETGYRANSLDSFEKRKNIDSNNEKSEYATLDDYIWENKKRNKDDQYNRGLRIFTTPGDDKKLITQGDNSYKKPYALRENKKGQNCGDLVGDIVINAHIDGVRGNKKGTLGFTRPNKQYKQFKKDNSSAKEIEVLE